MSGIPSWDDTVESAAPSWDDTTEAKQNEPAMFLGPEDENGQRHAVPSTRYNEPPKERGIVQRAKEGAASAYEEPLGFSPENQKRFPALGWLQQHVPAITAADAATRLPGALWGGLSGAAAGVAEKAVGPSWADQLQRDLHAMPTAFGAEMPRAAGEVGGLQAAAKNAERRPVVPPPPLPAEAFPNTPRQTMRAGADVGLLPAETPHALPPERSGLSAAGVGGPLSGISKETIDHMRALMEEQGYNEHTIDQRLGEMSAHHFFGEINPSLEGDMGAVAATSRPANLEIQGSVRQRALEAVDRVKHAFTRAFGPAENLPQAKRLREIERNQEADPLYRQFRETTITPTPEIEALLPRLEAAGVLQGANRDLRIAGEPTTRGFQIPGEPPTMQNVPTAAAFQAALQQISGKVGTAMRAGDMNEVRLLSDLRRDLTGALDTHPNVGEKWRKARETYARPAAIQDATKMGRDVLTNNITADELPFLTSGYSEPEVQAMRAGMRDYLEQMLGKRDALSAQVLNTVLSPNNVRKMQWAIGDQKADALVSEIRHEEHMHTAPTRIYGGSPTGFRTAAQKRWSVQPGALDNVGLSDVAHAAAHPVKAVVGKVAEEVGLSHRRKQEAAMAKLRQEASHIFTLQGPERDAVARHLVGGVGAQPYKRGGVVRRKAIVDGDKRAPLIRRAMQKPRKAGGGKLTSDDIDLARAPFGVAAPAEIPEGSLQGRLGSHLVSGAVESAATLPKRSYEAAKHFTETGEYDPAPFLEAATLPMGTGALVGVPMRAGEMALGSGALRRGKGMTGLHLPAAEEGERATLMPQLAERYPEIAPPVEKIDKVTGNPYLGKDLSQEALELKKHRLEMKPDIEAGRYEPYFDPAKRADVDAAHYPPMTDTTSLLMKKPATREQYDLMAANPEAVKRLDEAYARGLQQKSGAGDWYFMKQLEDEFVKEYGPANGRKLFKERFADAMAATTGGADPTGNLLMAHYGNYLKARGAPVPQSNALPYPVGGQYAAKNMDQFRKMIMEEQGINEMNPKRYNFSGNFLGQRSRATIDEQMSRLFNPKMQKPPDGSYGHFENVLAARAAHHGVDPRFFQEVAWAGAKDAAEKGGYAAKPMISHVNDAIERTHRITGMPRDEIVRRALVRAEIPLYGAAGAAAVPMLQRGDDREGMARGGAPRNPFFAEGGTPSPFDWSGVGEAMPEHIGRANIVDPLARAVTDTATLPKRAMDASERMVRTGEYDPAPAVEAASWVMGGPRFGGVRLRPGEMALGSGPIRAVEERPQARYTGEPQGAPREQAAPQEPAAGTEARLDDGRGLAGSPGGVGGLEEAQGTAARWAGARAPLEGLPTDPIPINGKPFVPGPIGKIHDVAEQYMREVHPDRPYTPPDKYHPLDKEHSAAIAQAYEDMPHTPNDPATKASYQALINETKKQYQAIKKTGLKIEPIRPGMDDPYAANPRMAAIDVAENNHLWFYPTEQGFGTLNKISDNPMLSKTGEKIGKHDLLANDMFRVVHDYFGHLKEGHGFRAAGEDNAWRTHSAMYSDIARPAMTTETRGQNSWVNYGPHGEKNRTASAADTTYADQKVGLMPEWTMRDRGSPEPVMVYNGSPHTFDRFDMRKIGSGEGNAAFGHGLYFGGIEPVAEWYRHQLAVRHDPLLKKYGLNEVGQNMGLHLADTRGNAAQLAAKYAAKRQELIESGAMDKASQNQIEDYSRRIDYLNDPKRATGKLYKVGLNVDPAKLLDWNAERLSEQSPHVQGRVGPEMEKSIANQKAALEERLRKGTSGFGSQQRPMLPGNRAALEQKLAELDPERINGEEIYRRMGFPASNQTEGFRQASSRLLGLDVPGHRYLADTLHSRTGSKGSHNYVMYGDEPISIMRRYTKGGEVRPIGRRLAYANP